MQKLIPPYLFLLLLGAIAGGTLIFPSARPLVSGPFFAFFALAVGACGAGLLIHATNVHKRWNASHNTFDVPDALMTKGPFRFSRNPMYLGFVMVLLCVAMLANAPWAFAAPALFFLVSNIWYIPFEERLLRDKFGNAYCAYLQTTRRWF